VSPSIVPPGRWFSSGSSSCAAVSTTVREINVPVQSASAHFVYQRSRELASVYRFATQDGLAIGRHVPVRRRWCSPTLRPEIMIRSFPQSSNAANEVPMGEHDVLTRPERV